MVRKRISRRQFLETSVMGSATAASSRALDTSRRAGAKGVGEQNSSSGLRFEHSLNEGWSFKRQASPGSATEAEFVGTEQPEYNDSSWTQVWLPHTWDATPDNPFLTSGHFRGIGWYRKKFEVPEEQHDLRSWLHFKGVFQVADVWINGRHAGQHVGGYTSFAFDVTEFLQRGRPNLLAVKVDDVLNPFVAPAQETNVANYGGIYRTVSLETMNSLHVRDNGTWVTVEGNEEAPIVRVRTWLLNQSHSRRDVRLEHHVVDAEGKSGVKLDASAVIESGQENFFDLKTSVIASPHLWSPDSPYLYEVVTTIWEGERAVDRCVTPLGIRFIRHDPSTGFLLNGSPINLHGVNRRQDYGFLGDAVPEAVAVRDVRLMKEMGVNFFRTSHYPQDPVVLEACDELGILVWEEVPNIKIHVYNPPEDGGEPLYTTRFPRPLVDNIKQQLKEMIECDRNHPSIIIWGLADDLSRYQYPEDFVELSNATHALDPTRWTAGRAPHVTDVIDATTFDDLWGAHEKHPERRYIWNEWGAIACERGREGPALIHGEEVRAVADSEGALFQEGYLMQWNAMPWLGTLKWCMFDCGELNGTSTRTLWEFRDGKVTLRWPFNDYLGVSDMWRLPKNAFFFLQSQWTEQPMVRIVGHWTWPELADQQRSVRVYSNCDTVELLLNGRSLGLRQPVVQERVWEDFRRMVERYKSLADEVNQKRLPGAHLLHPPFVWDQVSYQPGTLVAVGQKGNKTVRHELRTAGTPQSILLKAENQALKADGRDVSFIEADIVDDSGTIVPAARPWISFAVKGPARLLGGTTQVDAISGMAAINVQSTGQVGEILLEAKSPGLGTGSARLAAVQR
jgi:beta-galactosidase